MVSGEPCGPSTHSWEGQSGYYQFHLFSDDAPTLQSLRGWGWEWDPHVLGMVVSEEHYVGLTW